MPIYAYRCTSCGHDKEVLQKISDPVLTDCPACGAATFSKQVTAAGFQLKGSGWYVTDFREGNKATAVPAPSGDAASAAAATSAGTSAASSSSSGTAAQAATSSAAPSQASSKASGSSPAPASSPATNPSGAA